MQYLYGLEIHSIQSYIFSTNKLREIIGASEIVEFLSQSNIIEDGIGLAFERERLLSHAAGRIIYRCAGQAEAELLCEKVDKKIRSRAASLSYSQAVVELESNDANYSKSISSLFMQLSIQRKLIRSSEQLSSAIQLKDRRTGQRASNKFLPRRDEHKYISKSVWQKDDVGRRINQNPKESLLLSKLDPDIQVQYPTDISELGSAGQNSWIAVIHADGNEIGQVIKELNKANISFKAFSEYLKIVTSSAITLAIKKTFSDELKDDEIPGIRPLIIGGDDITVICEASQALKFTEAYLQAYEDYSFKLPCGGKSIELKLTACAGIAFTKAKFPFHYGHSLAEELCTYAKKKLKEGNRKVLSSGLCFHKVRDTIFDDYEDLLERELSIELDNKNKKRLLTQGPYVLNREGQDWPLLKELFHNLEVIDQAAFPAGPIRDYLSELHEDQSLASHKWDSIKSWHPDQLNKLQLDLKDGGYLIHDSLSLKSIQSKY